MSKNPPKYMLKNVQKLCTGMAALFYPGLISAITEAAQEVERRKKEMYEKAKDFPRFLGLTWVGWLNVVILQWLFFRMTTGQRIVNKRWVHCFGLVLFVLPLSGWWNKSGFIGPCVWIPLYGPNKSRGN